MISSLPLLFPQKKDLNEKDIMQDYILCLCDYLNLFCFKEIGNIELKSLN